MLIKLRREIGRKLQGELDTEVDLGIGTMKDDFQPRGTRPDEMERLKIWQRGKAIEEAVDLSIQEEMPSGPDAVLVGS